MADFVATIKVNIEAATGDGATGAAAGGGEGGVDVTGPIIRTVKQLQEEFRNLSAQVRSVATSLEQIRNVQGASSNTGAPSDVSGVDQSLVEILKALLETGTAAKGAADATKEQTAATDEATRATKESTDAKSQEADMHAKASREAEAHARASEAATAADRARTKALKALQGDAPVRAPAKFGGSGAGQLSNVRLFEDLIKSVGDNPELRALAIQTGKDLSDMVKIPKGASAEVQKEGEELRKSIGTIIRKTIKDINSGLATPKGITDAGRAITSQISDTRQRLPAGVQAPTADTAAITRGLGAKALVFEINRVNTSIGELGKAIEEGADGLKVEQLRQASSELLGSVVKLSTGISNRVLDTDRRTGQDPITGASNILRSFQAEGLARTPNAPTDPRQLKAFETLRQSLNDSVPPLETIRRVVGDIVDGGRGLGDARENLLGLLDSARRLSRGDFQSDQIFLNFEKALGALKKVGVNEDFGQITGPAGAVSQDDALISGQRAIQLARQRLAERAATRGPGQGGTLTDSVDLQLPTDTGGVRKIKVELEALGTTVDSVKVKAKDLSANMFDRTSVRAALQRVAVWSAAAGLVFGAFTALRQGLSVIIDTESALIGLAKVMNESAVNLVAFKNTAQEAALAIANDFGQPLEQTLETMILFGQQGKNLADTIALTRAAALASSVTTLDQPEAASALTAATQQFGLAFSEAESIVDKFNEVSNNAAVTETDLAQALKKAGQAARLAGLDLDQFNGVVSAIAEQTRQSGNEIGTALRFIFSRLQTPEAESGLAQVGVSARDAAGNVRPFTSLIEELAGKFDTLTASQRTQVAISIAGTRRFNTLLALLDNFGRFQQSAADSANSAGSALREQAKVTETAAFKIEQLKNSLKELALSFGDSLVDPLKLAVGTLSSLVGVISAIPGSIKTMVATIGIGSLAFLKFSDHITDFLGLAGSVKDATAVIGGSLRTNITQGLSPASQTSRFGDAALTASLGVSAARGAPDINLSNIFGKNKTAVSAFSKELSASNLLLKTQRGAVLESTAAFGKFGSTIRGFGVTADKGITTSALALGGLNSGITKFGAFLGILANRITKTIPVVSTLFERLDIAAGKSGKASTALAGTFLRFATAAAVIYGVVRAFQALGDAAFESAEEVASELEPEIQRRREAIALLNEQEQRVKSLTDARRKAASVTSPGPFERLSAPQEQDVLSGGFKSAVVAIQRIREQEQEAANQIGFANPELIDSIDEFGNVVLSSADAFDVLAGAASNAQEVLLGLTQVDIIGAFSEELEKSSGILPKITDHFRDLFSGTVFDFVVPDDAFQSARDKFDKQLASFKEKLDQPVVKEARALGVPVSVLDPEKGKELSEAGRSFQQESLEIRRIVESTVERIRSLPEDSGQIIFEALAADAKSVFDAQVQLLSTQGIETSTEALINQARLQNQSALKEVRDQIAATPELTIGNLREAGRLTEFVDIDAIRENTAAVRNELLRFSGDELILFKDVQGIDRQAVVEVTATGKRQISFIADELGTIVTQELSDVFSSAIGEIQFIDVGVIREQVTAALQEIGRIVSGAGRGGILQKDLELGVDFRSDLTAQQRAAQGDELLFTDLQAAQQQLTGFRESFGAPTKEGQESPSQVTDPEHVIAIQNMARAIDELATKAKLAVEIEKVGIAFEKAVDKIRNSRIEEAISAEFSGALGATTGALKRAFETPVLAQNLDPSSTADRESQGLVQLGNVLSRVQKANGEMISGLRVASSNIDTFVRDFENAGVRGAARDPNRVSDLARRSAALSNTGLDRTQSILTSLNAEQLTAQEKTNEILAHIDANFRDSPRLIGAALAQSVISAKGDEEGIASLAAGIKEQGTKVASFTPQDLQTILSNVPSELIPNVVKQFRESQAPGAAGGLITSLTSIGKGTPGAATAPIADKLPTEVFKQVSSSLQTAISSAFTDAQFTKILSDPERLGEVKLDSGKIEEVLDVALSSLKDSGNKNARKAAGEIEAAIKQGGEGQKRVFTAVRDAILKTVSVGTPREAPTVEVGKSLQQTREEADKLAAAMEATVRANDAVLKPLRDATGAFFAFQDAITGVTKSLRSAAQQAADDISIGRQTQRFTTPQVGLLSGVSLATSAPDQRRRLSDLSGGELTALESPQLSRGLNEVNVAFDALIGQLTNVKQEQANAQRALEGFQSEGNVRGIKLAQEALVQLGSISNLVEGQINNAQGTLKNFGEAFRDIEAVNQLRVDVEKLVDAFDREITLRFDRTSIATALGNTLFSATRPTFEQFEQGQSGFLTKFERSLASIDFQESAGTITRQEATRGRAEVEFSKAEDIIALAQSRENEKLQSAISSAEQVRSRLFDFVQTGAPGTEVAQKLLDQITSELESAGDILPGGTGRTSIRDPRTGQQVDVQASAINSFRGLPGLSNITQQLTQLSQSATKSGAQENADLITKPLLTVLDQIPNKLDEVVNELKKAGDLEDPEGEENFTSGLLNLQKELSSLLAPLQREEPLTQAAVSQITTSLANIARLDPDTLARVLQEGVAAPGGAGTEKSLLSFLKEDLARAETRPGTSNKGDIQAGINSILEQASKSASASFDLLETPILNVATAGDQAATHLGLMSGATEVVTSKLTEASDAITAFNSSLKGGLSDVFKSIGDKLKDFFTGSADPFGPNVQRRASGGFITGPGGPTEDKVPVLASPGEFVINAKAAKSLGPEVLNRLNGSSGKVGADSRAAGAAIGLRAGGDPEKEELFRQQNDARFKRQQEEVAASRVRAAEEEAKKNESNPDKFRDEIAVLERKKEKFLEESPPNQVAAGQVQFQIDQKKKQLANAEKKRAAEKARLQELIELGIRRKEVPEGLAIGEKVEGSIFTVPESALKTKSREELVLKEKLLRDTMSQRRHTFQATPEGREGKNFVRLTEDGRYVFQGDSSGGAVDVRSLIGVSTRDPEEFKSELKRRKEFAAELASVEINKEKEKRALEVEFSTLSEKEEEDEQRSFSQESYALAVSELQEILRQRTGEELEALQRHLGSAQDGIGLAHSMLKGEGDFGRDDFIIQSQELERVSSELGSKFSFLKQAEPKPLTLFAPPDFSSKEPIGGQVRGIKGLHSIGIGRDLGGRFTPGVFGRVLSSTPGVEEFISEALGSQLDEATAAQAKELKDGSRFSGFRRRENILKKGAEAISSVRNFLPDGAIGSTANAALLALETGVSGIDLVVGESIGIGGDIISPERNEAAAVLVDLTNRAREASFDDAVDFVKQPFTHIGDTSERLSNLKIELEYAKTEGDKRRLNAEITAAESELATGLFNVYLGGRGFGQTLASGKRIIAPTGFGLSKKSKALKKASSVDDIGAARDLASTSRKQSLRQRKSDPAESRQSQADADAYNDRANKLAATAERRLQLQDAKRARADSNAVRAAQRAGLDPSEAFGRNLEGVKPSASPLREVAEGFLLPAKVLATPITGSLAALSRAEKAIGSSRAGVAVKSKLTSVKDKVLSAVEARKQRAAINAEATAESVAEGHIPPPKPTRRQRVDARREAKAQEKKLESSVEGVIDAEGLGTLVSRADDIPAAAAATQLPPGTGTSVLPFSKTSKAAGGIAGSLTTLGLAKLVGLAGLGGVPALGLGAFLGGKFLPKLFRGAKGLGGRAVDKTKDFFGVRFGKGNRTAASDGLDGQLPVLDDVDVPLGSRATSVPDIDVPAAATAITKAADILPFSGKSKVLSGLLGGVGGLELASALGAGSFLGGVPAALTGVFLGARQLPKLFRGAKGLGGRAVDKTKDFFGVRFGKGNRTAAAAERGFATGLEDVDIPAATTTFSPQGIINEADLGPLVPRPRTSRERIAAVNERLREITELDKAREAAARAPLEARNARRLEHDQGIVEADRTKARRAKAAAREKDKGDKLLKSASDPELLAEARAAFAAEKGAARQKAAAEAIVSAQRKRKAADLRRADNRDAEKAAANAQIELESSQARAAERAVASLDAEDLFESTRAEFTRAEQSQAARRAVDSLDDEARFERTRDHALEVEAVPEFIAPTPELTLAERAQFQIERQRAVALAEADAVPRHIDPEISNFTNLQVGPQAGPRRFNVNEELDALFGEGSGAILENRGGLRPEAVDDLRAGRFTPDDIDILQDEILAARLETTKGITTDFIANRQLRTGSSPAELTGKPIPTTDVRLFDPTSSEALRVTATPGAPRGLPVAGGRRAGDFPLPEKRSPLSGSQILEQNKAKIAAEKIALAQTEFDIPNIGSGSPSGVFGAIQTPLTPRASLGLEKTVLARTVIGLPGVGAEASLLSDISKASLSAKQRAALVTPTSRPPEFGSRARGLASEELVFSPTSGRLVGADVVKERNLARNRKAISDLQKEIEAAREAAEAQKVGSQVGTDPGGRKALQEIGTQARFEAAKRAAASKKEVSVVSQGKSNIEDSVQRELDALREFPAAPEGPISLPPIPRVTSKDTLKVVKENPPGDVRAAIGAAKPIPPAEVAGPPFELYTTKEGQQRIRFKASEAYTLKEPNPGRNYTTDTYAALTEEGIPFVHEGRHRAVGAAKGADIPEELGGIPDRPGYLDYEFTPETAPQGGVRIRDLSTDNTARDVGLEEAKKIRDALDAELLADLINPKKKFALGGKINGPGGPTSDRIPILASAGEFVLNANAVGKLGLPVVESMNRTGILPKFQNGGLIEDEDRARTPGEVLGREPDLFDIISGRAGGIDVGAALKSTGDTRNKKLYINNTTGEEVLASGLLAEELESQGFSLAPVSPDFDLLSALADGKKVYTNSRTGESVTASEAADRELRAKGFKQDSRPLSELLQGGLLQNSDGSLTLLSPGDSGVVGPRTPEERARLASVGLQAQREANARFSEGATAGLASQREANARFSAGAQSALLASQGRTEMSAVLPGNTGNGSRLQGLADELELERFNAGGLLRGPGGPKSDDIPILASNGEFIVNADAAGKLGLATLEQLNTTGKLPGFQNGGDVSGRSSGGSVSVNTEEIAAAIREAIIQATSEASITINTETAADSISSAISRALAGMEFPDVKLDTSSLDSLSLGNSVGADIISKVKLLEGSVTRISDSTNDILDDLSELNTLKDNFARQEEDILNKVEFRINKENSVATTSTGPSTVNLDRDIKIIRAEMLRLERDLQQTTTQASLALSKAQAK